MLFKLLCVLLMLVGLVGTFIPKVPGNVIIAIAAVGYSLWNGNSLPRILVISLSVLLILGDVGGRLLRYYLTRNDPVSLRYSVNSTLGYFAGLVVTDALFGFIVGMVMWEMLSGKAWRAHGRDSLAVLLKASAAAIFRFACGSIMIGFIIFYLY